MKRVMRFVLWLLLIELALAFWWTWRLEQRAVGPAYYLGAHAPQTPAPPWKAAGARRSEARG